MCSKNGSLSELDIALERTYPTPYANSPLLPLLLLTLLRQRVAPKVTYTFRKEYDYIVVGGGSAGSVVAGRLSEEPCVNVLLLEAGGKPPLLSDVPGLARSFYFTDIDWKYKTVPQKNTARVLVNQQVVWPSGKGLGGSSLISAMVYSRGNRKNYDDWAEQGAVGWSYAEVLPYFIKLEDNRDFEFVANGYHGVGGPVSVEKPRYHSEIKHPILEAAQQFGYQIVDPNAEQQTGFYDFQAFIGEGQRSNAAKGYLVPAENRTNLDILPYAFVTKVLMDGRQAVGVQFFQNGLKQEIRARRDVIMAAGAINTAQILMLSGIGPREHLEKFNIAVNADLPVGNNLQDHCGALLYYQLDPKIPTVEEKLSALCTMEQYIGNRSGPLASAEFFTNVAFIKGETAFPLVDFPDNEICFWEYPKVIPQEQHNIKPEIYQQIFGPYEGIPIYACLAFALQPKSTGTVRLQSDNPYDEPLIDPNYFEDPKDIEYFVQAMKVCHKIATSEPMQKVGSKPFDEPFPGCEGSFGDDERYYECIVRSFVFSLTHQVGTAKMGDPRDPTTVVDPKLRVKGVGGLRIVDASVMPIIPSANTYAPVIMVAEKASDIIKEDIYCAR